MIVKLFGKFCYVIYGSEINQNKKSKMGGVSCSPETIESDSSMQKGKEGSLGAAAPSGWGPVERWQ